MNLVRIERGQTLIEVLFALAILGLVAVAFLTAISTSGKAIIVADKRTTAESIIRMELEYIKNVDYDKVSSGFYYRLPGSPPTWDPTHSLPSHFVGYSLLASGVRMDPNTGGQTQTDTGILNVCVTVFREGQQVLSICDYKVRR